MERGYFRNFTPLQGEIGDNVELYTLTGIFGASKNGPLMAAHTVSQIY